jgi:iron complex outermembrane receptor protein
VRTADTLRDVSARNAGDRFRTRLFLLCLVSTGVLSARALAVDAALEAGPLAEVVVTGTTPVPGASIALDKIPGNVQVLSASDLSREGSPSLTGALNSNLSSVSISDDLDDPFQPNIIYRGFEASPVLGTPQGLAVYQNGVRINEAFGSTVNWDLFPDVAIGEVQLIGSSPLYGLNALGGALSVTMKNGFTYQGGNAELEGGSYHKRSLVAQYGARSGPLGFYLAGRALDWAGWRQLSGDHLRTMYMAVSYLSDRARVDLGYTRARNRLLGVGATPLQELAVSRSLPFTGPQADKDDLDFLSLNGALDVNDRLSLQAVLYYRSYAQEVSNGNTTNYVACANTPGVLCHPDGVTPLSDAAGQAIPDISNGGTAIIGENDFELIHAWGRGATLQLTDAGSLLGRASQFSAGAAIDFASTGFFSGAQVGTIDANLLVSPSGFHVYTPENSPAALANGDSVPVNVDSVVRNIGFYFTDTLDVTPTLAVSASGRYNIAHIGLTDRLGANLDGHSRFVHFNPAIGATYRLRPAATLYGGWSTNTRTPTASEIECSDPLAPCLLPTNLAGDPPNLRQVVSYTVEVGVRGRREATATGGRQFNWNLGAFRTQLHDDIYGIATSVSRGYFRNIGDTRREGFEAGVHVRGTAFSAYANYSYVLATFRTPFVTPSPSNPFHDSMGNINVLSGDRLPGIPEHRVKLGADIRIVPAWTLGAALNVAGPCHYFGDGANRVAPVPGYWVMGVHTSYRPLPRLELIASATNVFNRKYSTRGVLGDPTGVGAPGVPTDGGTDGRPVDTRFQSPAAPLEISAGFRIGF